MPYWLVGVPTEGAHQRTVDNLSSKVSRTGTTAYHFAIPDLKVGTLDTLMKLSEELSRADTQVEGLVRRLERTYYEHAGNREDNPLTVDNVPLDTYITNFSWNAAKFPLLSPLSTMTEYIRERAGKDDEELKQRNYNYNEVRSLLGQYEKKEQSNLTMKPLAGIVKPQHVIETDRLTTAFIVVSLQNKERFLQSYEGLVPEWVVPRSARLIEQEGDYFLYSVLLFRKVLDDFKAKVKEERFTLREFQYDEKEVSEHLESKPKLEAKKNSMRADLLLWCGTAFSETFISWIHLKAIRLFVESVLRFGLPVNFTGILLRFERRNEKKLRSSLGQAYSHLGNQFTSVQEETATAAGADSGGDFYPYVFLSVDTDKSLT